MLTPEQQGVILLQIVQDFIQKYDITCPETIYQTDRVIENATTLIEELCDVVGYNPIDD